MGFGPLLDVQMSFCVAGARHCAPSQTEGFGPLLEVLMWKKCTLLWREAHFQVQSVKNWRSQTTFGSWHVEKVHAVVERSTFLKSKCARHTNIGPLVEKVRTVVERSTFPSQNVQSTPALDHFWKLTCRKSARRCGAKQISKSKCTKHTSSRPLLEIDMSKKCTPLWREVHFQVKM